MHTLLFYIVIISGKTTNSSWGLGPNSRDLGVLVPPCGSPTWGWGLALKASSRSWQLGLHSQKPSLLLFICISLAPLGAAGSSAWSSGTRLEPGTDPAPVMKKEAGMHASHFLHCMLCWWVRGTRMFSALHTPIQAHVP